MDKQLNNTFGPALLACDPGVWRHFCSTSIEMAKQAGVFSMAGTGDGGAINPIHPKIPGVAVIPVEGILLGSVPAWYRRAGIKATGYDEVCAGVARADADPNVREILLWVNSPGGVVFGADAAADAIWWSDKRVSAHVAGECLSGAYWLASQADWITASEASRVGGIGCFSVYYDNSAALEKAGIRPVVIRSGALKATGIGEISREQEEAAQRLVDATADIFFAAVARGRRWGKSSINFWSDGVSLIAKKAENVGMVDAVQNTWAPKTQKAHENIAPTKGSSNSKIEAGVREERSRCRALIEKYGARAIRHIETGATIEEARLRENPSQGDFMRLVGERASREGKPASVVMNIVAKEFPEAFNAMRGIESSKK